MTEGGTSWSCEYVPPLLRCVRNGYKRIVLYLSILLIQTKYGSVTLSAHDNTAKSRAVIEVT